MRDDLESARELVRFLCSAALRQRSGILLLPHEALGDEANLVTRLGIALCNYHQHWLNQLDPDAQFAPLSAQSLESDLDTIANQVQIGGCVLVQNLDLALAKLEVLDRERFWDDVLHTLLPHSTSAILLGVPAGATHLLPDLAPWQEGRRVASVGVDGD